MAKRAPVTCKAPEITAWIWENGELLKRQCPDESSAKLWLFDRLGLTPSATEYGYEGPGIEFLSAAARERMGALNHCAICCAPKPRIIDAERGPVCDECSEALEAGEDPDPVAALTEAILGEGCYL